MSNHTISTTCAKCRKPLALDFGDVDGEMADVLREIARLPRFARLDTTWLLAFVRVNWRKTPVASRNPASARMARQGSR